MKPIFSLFLVTCLLANSQQKSIFKSATIIFYNTENLYDTIENPLYRDEEFTPTGARKYSGTIYTSKLNNIVQTLASIGSNLPAFIGLAEIENDWVLNDIVNHSRLRTANYSFVHYDSRDARGIDVALLYQPSYFKAIQSKAIQVILPEGSKTSRYTRDILWVEGFLDGELIDIYINHWPSRYGGTNASEPARMYAANVLKRHIDSIKQIEIGRKIIIMGDFNDNPSNKSIYQILGAKEKAIANNLYNPFHALYMKGIGTLAFQDAWALFDQIILSQEWLDKKQKGFFYYRSGIYNASFLTENIGKYKGYPMRSWDGYQFRNGYSDHYPVYLSLLKSF